MSDSARRPDTMDPELLREDAERTREQLGQTVQELADKLDVPSRAKKAARRVQHKVAGQARAIGPQPLAGAAIAVALLLAWWTIRRWIR
jgi:transcription initiation factor TFIIIB Brf1 subunit/transcription initiation factor TFIIB